MPDANQNSDALGIARLEVQLKTVLDQLSIVSTNMVTKDLWTAQNTNIEFRFQTIEQALNATRSDTIKDVAKVDSESKARDQAGAAAATAAAKEITDRLDKQEERQFQIEQTQKDQKSSKWTAVGITVLGALLTIITTVVINVVSTGGITPN